MHAISVLDGDISIRKSNAKKSYAAGTRLGYVVPILFSAYRALKRDSSWSVTESPPLSVLKNISLYVMFNGESAPFTVAEKHCDGFRPIAQLTSFFRDGDVAFQHCKTIQEAGVNLVSLDDSIHKALRRLGKMFLEDIDTVIAHMTTFSSSS